MMRVLTSVLDLYLRLTDPDPISGQVSDIQDTDKNSFFAYYPVPTLWRIIYIIKIKSHEEKK